MMQKEYGDAKLLGDFLASHPNSSTRIQDIHNLADKNGYSQKATIPFLSSK
jgi:predicted Zn-dependent protease